MTVNHTSSSGVGKLWERFFWPFSSGTLDVVDVSSLESMFKQALSIAPTVGLSLLTRWTVRGVPGVFRCPLNSLIVFAMISEQSWRGKLKMPELTAGIATEWNLWSSTTLCSSKFLHSSGNHCWCRFWRKTRAHCMYYFFTWQVASIGENCFTSFQMTKLCNVFIWLILNVRPSSFTQC